MKKEEIVSAKQRQAVKLNAIKCVTSENEKSLLCKGITVSNKYFE